jgi:DNA-binding NtrC family response regulator
LDAVLELVEREQIQAALDATRQNLTKAAEMLGLSRPKLYRRLEALGLLPDDTDQAPSSS